MELRVLRYFLAVAREESITAAANQLHVTQPTLSRQLMDLEEELGKPLFLRGNRRITLTEEGRFLRKRAQEIIDLTDKTEAEFNDIDGMIAGDVHIGAGETQAIRLLAKTARRLRIEQPHIHYQLFSGNADDVTEKLDKGLLDFGIVIEPVDISKYDSLQLPYRDVWGVLMRKDAPLTQKDAVTPSDLAGLPLLCSRQALIKNDLSDWYNGDFEHLEIVARYNLIYNAALMVEEGMGYAITLDGLVNTTGDSALCFRPLAPKLTAGLYLIWKKYQVFSKASEKFLACLREDLTQIEE
ncbi:LysR family transcriptional regulator [Ihubacter sp. mB4P-1]|uniref:LysR family transcriptional regulator n=1 Tax=Ihubacter sp. mB4P-1 TaxID=3242370 RepID=UPI0013797894